MLFRECEIVKKIYLSECRFSYGFALSHFLVVTLQSYYCFIFLININGVIDIAEFLAKSAHLCELAIGYSTRVVFFSLTKYAFDAINNMNNT